MSNPVKALFHQIYPKTPPKKQQSDGTGTPEVLYTPPSSCALPTTEFEAGHQCIPRELAEMIFSYVHDTATLRSCSLTCRIWYYAAKPRFHYSLKTFRPKILISDDRLDWPNPLLKAHELHLLPFIKRFSIVFTDSNGFTRRRFGNGPSLCCFSALENLQELRIDHLSLSSFMPYIKEYFGHFPILRSLTLDKPKASCRQLLYFIGLFPYLQDLKLLYFRPTKEDRTTDKSALVPPSIPPLGGWLTLVFYKGEEFVNEMIALYGKLPFRCVNLSRVECTQRVLDGCAGTLETLQLRPVTDFDFEGEHSFG
jgi:hypothetical protein